MTDERMQKAIKIVNASGFFQLLGMEFFEAEGGKSRMRMTVGEKHLNPMGIAHGGVYCAALDAAIWFACFSSLEPGKNMTSVEMKVNYLVPARPGEIFAEGCAIYRGKSILVGEASVVDATGLMFAKAVGTCMVLPR